MNLKTRNTISIISVSAIRRYRAKFISITFCHELRCVRFAHAFVPGTFSGVDDGGQREREGYSMKATCSPFDSSDETVDGS